MEGIRDGSGRRGRQPESVRTYHGLGTRRSHPIRTPVPRRPMTMSEEAAVDDHQPGEATATAVKAAAVGPWLCLPLRMLPFVWDELDVDGFERAPLTPRNSVPLADCTVVGEHCLISVKVDSLFLRHYVLFLTLVACLKKFQPVAEDLAYQIPSAITLSPAQRSCVSTGQFLIKVLVFCDRECKPI